jgi:putative glutamine amidotransferase
LREVLLLDPGDSWGYRYFGPKLKSIWQQSQRYADAYRSQRNYRTKEDLRWQRDDIDEWIESETEKKYKGWEQRVAVWDAIGQYLDSVLDSDDETHSYDSFPPTLETKDEIEAAVEDLFTLQVGNAHYQDVHDEISADVELVWIQSEDAVFWDDAVDIAARREHVQSLIELEQTYGFPGTEERLSVLDAIDRYLGSQCESTQIPLMDPVVSPPRERAAVSRRSQRTSIPNNAETSSRTRGARPWAHIQVKKSGVKDAPQVLNVEGSGERSFLVHGADVHSASAWVSEDELRERYDETSHVYIPGGSDIDPQFYGDNPHPNLGPTNERRDQRELKMVQWALEDDKPTFGICRGHQMITVAAGGTLYQDIPTQVDDAIQHRGGVMHEIEIAEDSRLAALLETTEIEVNSYHHQAVREVPPGWRAVAWAPDGVIEAIEHEEKPVISVQFHPERMYQDDDRFRGLYHWFLNQDKEV